MPSKLRIKRISTSPYFKESFVQLEKKVIESKALAEMLAFNAPEMADVLITNTHTTLEQISTQDISQCKLMIHPNSGYDNFSADFVKKAPFPIVIGNPIRSHAVANFILCALFSHYGPLPIHKVWDKQRSWPRKLLSELSVLILGDGHITSLLEGSLRHLVSQLSIYDPYSNESEKKTLPDLKTIDVLIPACSLNERNTHLINYEWLMSMKEDFLLINAARGQLVNTQDLISVLKNKEKAHAILDVFEDEPADFSLFYELSNIQLSSHIAGVYAEIDQVSANYSATVIFDFQNLSESAFNQKYQSTLLINRLQGHFLI